jgi:hypothetical protein
MVTALPPSKLKRKPIRADCGRLEMIEKIKWAVAPPDRSPGGAHRAGLGAQALRLLSPGATASAGLLPAAAPAVFGSNPAVRTRVLTVTKSAKGIIARGQVK